MKLFPILLSSLSSLLLLSLGQSAEPSWPLFRGDAGMTGLSAEKLVPPLKLLWSTPTVQPGVAAAAPVKGEDPAQPKVVPVPVPAATGKKPGKNSIMATPIIAGGHIFIGDGKKTFHAYDLVSGKEVWKFEAQSHFEGSACLAGDLVVVGCNDAFVYAFKQSDGDLVWKFETDGQVLGSPNFLPATEILPKKNPARILIGSYDNSLYCLDAATGKSFWKYETTNYINGAPSIHDGKVMVGGCDGFIYVLDVFTGKEVSKIENGAYIANTLAVQDGTLYTAHYGNKVNAYNLADGKKLWEFSDRDFAFYASPALTKELVIVGGRDKRLRALDRATGQQKWEYRARGAVDSSPLVSGDFVYVGGDDGILRAVSLATGDEAWAYELGAAIKSSPVIVGGKLVVGCDDGSVYAFAAEAKS